MTSDHREQSALVTHYLDRLEERLATTSDPDERRSIESLAHAMITSLEFEDRWWTPIFGAFAQNHGNPNFVQLDNVQKVSHKITELCETNALLKAGADLKTNHVFGAGYSFDFPEQPKAKSDKTGRSLLPAKQAILDDPVNQELLLSELALKSANKAVYKSGNFYIGWDKAKRQFFRVYLSQIVTWISDDADISRVKYFLRKYTVQDDLGSATIKEVYEWIPTDSWDAEAGGQHQKSIAIQGKRHPVKADSIIIPFHPNIGEQQVFALPDAFAAVPWAIGYSDYLKNGAKLLDALSAIAFHVKAKTQATGAKIGAKVERGQVGGTLIGGSDTEIQQVPRANAVDLNTGRPLLSQAASALGVSTGSLATNVLEGGYASTAAVTAIEKQSALARQGDFEAFMHRVFRAIGLPDGRINFNRIDADPIHRTMQSAGLAFELGGINQQEFRTLALELLDIEGDPTVLPEPSVFSGSRASTLPKYIEMSKADDDTEPSPDGSAIPGQGQSGGVGALADGDHELRDE